MTKLGWFMAAVGWTVCVAVAAVIGYDCWLAAADRPTISHRLMELGFAHPGVAALLGCLFGLVAGLVVGCFIGHFWFPQYRDKG